MRQFAMAYYAGIGITPRQLLQQGIEGMLLLRRTGVFVLPVFIHPAFIDHAQGTAVVASGMDSLNGFGKQRNDSSVEADIVVVAALSVLGNAAVYKLLHAEGLVASGGRAMNNDISYRFQFFHSFILCPAEIINL